MTASAENFISIEKLDKSFQGVRVLKSFNLVVPRGKIITLLGPSGCGKTTTLRCIAGLEIPDAGTIRIGGVLTDGPGLHVAPRHRGLGIVFQSFALWPHLRVFENVAFPLRRKGALAAEITQRTTAMLAMVGLDHVADRYPGQLSGGQQQRVALARALVAEPVAILYDEPLSNLDAKLREQMRREIGDLHRRLNITAIFVTHDQEEAIDLSDEIHVMCDGVVVQRGAPIDIFDRPINRYVCEFFGQANVFSVTKVTSRDEKYARVATEGGLSIMCLPPQDPDASVSFAAVRPNGITLSSMYQPSPSHEFNCFDGVIRTVRHHSTHSRYQVDLGQGILIDVDASRPGPSFSIDEKVSARFPAWNCVGLRM